MVANELAALRANVTDNPADAEALLVQSDALEEAGDSEGAAAARRRATLLSRARGLLEQLTRCRGGSNASRIGRILGAAATLTDEELARAYFVTCADEKTGRRFGDATCRAGRCMKIGSTTYSYQLWLVWA